MQIRIQKCTDSMLWYYNRINEEFTVSRITNDNSSRQYWVRTGGMYNTLNFVHTKDCEVLKND